MQFNVLVAHRDPWTIISVFGEVELSTAPQLRQEMVGQVADGHHMLVVDLSGVEFIDSVGLGVLVGGLKRTRTHDGDLMIVCPDRRLRRIFQITDLDRVFTLHDTVDEAVGAGAR